MNNDIIQELRKQMVYQKFLNDKYFSGTEFNFNLICALSIQLGYRDVLWIY